MATFSLLVFVVLILAFVKAWISTNKMVYLVLAGISLIAMGIIFLYCSAAVGYGN